MSTYNRPEKLKRAIESVINQTYKDWELIVVHDGKKEGEPVYFQRYAAQIQHFYIDHFGNDTKPKNTGILKSTGDYIAFLDDDNEYKPEHLAILAKAAEQNPDIDVLYGDRLIVSDDEKDFTPQVGIASNFDAGLLFERNYIDTSDVLIKREALFLVGGWDERYRKYVDWNLWIRMTKAGLKFLHIPKLITLYHIHKQMKSLQVKDKVGQRPFGDTEPTKVFTPEWDGYELEIVLPYLGEKPLPKVAIFTLTMNRLEYTKVMYESLRKSGYPFDWYVIDQGSTDETVSWLTSLKDKTIHLTQLKENIGISKGSNLALNQIGDKYDFVLKIDNDAELLTNDWLLKLLRIFEAHWQIILSPYVEGLEENIGGSPRLAYRQLRSHLVGVTPHIGGLFVMAHKSAYKDFRWDEKDFLHGMQDLVFSREIQKKGYLVAYVEDMRVAHQKGTLGQKKEYPEYFKHRVYERTHTADGINERLMKEMK